MQGCSLLGARSTARPPQQGASVTVPSRRHAALAMARSASSPSAPAADKQARRIVMKKMSVIAASLLGAAVLCAVPISLHRSQDKALSLSVDKAQAYYGVYRRHYRRVYRRGYYGGGYYGYAHRPLYYGYGRAYG